VIKTLDAKRVQSVNFYSFYFSNISKTVLESSHVCFCREFQAMKKNRGEIL
jgi:hypothetical protein